MEEASPILATNENVYAVRSPLQGFICPLSRNIMIDPVVDADGNSFERRDVELWLSSHSTSPITHNLMKKLHLRPNVALKRCIQQFLEEKSMLLQQTNTRAVDAGVPQTEANINQDEIETTDNPASVTLLPSLKTSSASGPQNHGECSIMGQNCVSITDGHLVKHIANRGTLSFLPRTPSKYQQLELVCRNNRPPIGSFACLKTVSEQYCDEHIRAARENCQGDSRSFCQKFCHAVIQDRINFSLSKDTPPTRIIAAVQVAMNLLQMAEPDRFVQKQVAIECADMILSGKSKRRSKGCPVCALKYKQTNEVKIVQESVIQKVFAPNANSAAQSSSLPCMLPDDAINSAPGLFTDSMFLQDSNEVFVEHDYEDLDSRFQIPEGSDSYQ
eukprot:m.197007 g.197007  ORF g.197007 m.197007 type:complete len:387 (+) comp18706_c0_seq1:462-1622(+)